LDADRDQKVIKTFSHEVKALSQLSHPNVIAYHGCGQDSLGRPYLVMELIDGAHTLEEELAPALDARQGLPLTRVRWVLMEILSALEAAHALNMVHRDIKPGNIMLKESDGGPPSVKVLDFGLAKFTDEGDGTKTRHFAGTPMYAAPEQSLGQGIRGWTDLYAVAEIALEMIT
ncbi:MAG: serine/threonine protein kinase, partial [Myxococcales bacterium]|nr:serine/threonine protein kinase [Myxococcales bacterium]